LHQGTTVGLPSAFQLISRILKSEIVSLKERPSFASLKVPEAPVLIYFEQEGHSATLALTVWFLLAS